MKSISKTSLIFCICLLILLSGLVVHGHKEDAENIEEEEPEIIEG